MIALLAIAHLWTAPVRAAEPGVILNVSFLNGDDAEVVDQRQIYRRVRRANPGRTILTVSDDQDPGAVGTHEWSAKLWTRRQHLEAKLKERGDRPVDLVVIHAGHDDFSRLLDEVATDDPRAFLTPLRGTLAPNARVILLGHEPLGANAARRANARLVLDALDVPAATLLASHSALHLRESWRKIVRQLPMTAVAYSWAGLGGMGLSRLSNDANALITFGLIPTAFGAAYVIHKFRENVLGTSFARADVDDAPDGGYADMMLGSGTFAGAFTLGELMGAMGVVGVASAVAAKGMAVLDPHFVLTGAGLGVVYLGAMTALPVFDAIRTELRQKKGRINGGQSYQFAGASDIPSETVGVNFSRDDAYRCEADLGAAT